MERNQPDLRSSNSTGFNSVHFAPTRPTQPQIDSFDDVTGLEYYEGVESQVHDMMTREK